MHISKINILISNFLMSSTYFEPKGSYSERRFYMELRYVMVRFTCVGMSSLVGRRVCLILVVYNCIYNRLPEDEISGLKYVEDIKKIKN